MTQDGEMLRLSEFKTRCIRKFISNMQKWLDNWSLKQEYLVNLRKQFIVDNETLVGRIERAKGLGLCGRCQPSVQGELDILLTVYRKIEENYKMGNSFY